VSRPRRLSLTTVAEAILMSIGYLPLLNALIDLWQTRAEKGRITSGTCAEIHHSDRKIQWVKYVGWCVYSVAKADFRFLRFLLLASLATAIAAGVILSRDYNDQEQADIIRKLLKASYIVSLAVTVLGMVLKAISTVQNHEPIRQTMLLYAYSVPLLIVSIYRVVSR